MAVQLSQQPHPAIMLLCNGQQHVHKQSSFHWPIHLSRYKAIGIRFPALIQSVDAQTVASAPRGRLAPHQWQRAADSKQQASELHHPQEGQHQRRFLDDADKRARLLTARIKGSSSWEQVALLLQSYGSAANHIHLSAAVTHTAQMQQQTNQAYAELQPVLNFVSQTTQQLLQQHSAALQLRHTANLIWALAVLSSSGSSSSHQRGQQQQQQQHCVEGLVQQLLQLQTDQMQALQHQTGLHNTIMLPHHVSEAHQASSNDSANSCGSSSSRSSGVSCSSHFGIKAQDFSNTLWGLAALSIAPDQLWQQCCWTLSQQTLQNCDLQELSNMVWAVSKLQLHPPDQWLQAVMASAEVQLQHLQQQQTVVQPRDSRRRQQQQQQVRVPQALSNLAYALGKLGFTPGADWVSLFMAVSQQYLKHCSAGQLSMMLFGAAAWHLAAENQQAARGVELAHPATATTQVMLAAEPKHQLVSLPGWLAAYSECVQQQLPSYSTQALVNTASSCYKLLLHVRQSQQPSAAAPPVTTPSSDPTHTMPPLHQQQQEHATAQQQAAATCSLLQCLLGTVMPAAAAQGHHLSPSAAAALVWVASGVHPHQHRAAASPGPLGVSTQEWIQQYLRHAQAGLHVPVPGAVLDYLWLLAKSGGQGSECVFLIQLLDQASLEVAQYNPAQIAKLSWCLAQLLESSCAAGGHRDQDGRFSRSQQQGLQRGAANEPSTTQQQEQQQQQQSMQQLCSLSQMLLKYMSQVAGQMSSLQLVESAASAARIVAVLHSIQFPRSELGEQQRQHPQPQYQPASSGQSPYQHAVPVLLSTLATAAAPLASSLQPQSIMVLSRAFLLLLRHGMHMQQGPGPHPATASARAPETLQQQPSDPSCHMPFAAAAPAVKGVAAAVQANKPHAAVMLQDVQAVNQWVYAAAKQVVDLQLSKPDAVTLLLQVLALGQAAVRAAATGVQSSRISTAETARPLSPFEPTPSAGCFTASMTVGRDAGTAALLLKQTSAHTRQHAAALPQQQQQQALHHSQQQWQQTLHFVLGHLLPMLSQLQGSEALSTAAKTVRLRVLLPAGALSDLMYTLTKAVPRFSPQQLLQLLQLLPAWRHIPRAAQTAKSALLHSILDSIECILLQLQQQQPITTRKSVDGQYDSRVRGDAEGSSSEVDRGWTASASAHYVAIALTCLAAAHVQPSQEWLNLAVSVLVQHLGTQQPQIQQQARTLRDDLAQTPLLHAPTQGPTLNADKLSRVVLSLAILDYVPNSANSSALLKATQDTLPGMDRAQLVRTIRGMSQMAIPLDEPWLLCFYDQAQSAPGRFQLSGFGMVLWALAKSGAKPHHAWMAALLDSTYGWSDGGGSIGFSSSTCQEAVKAAEGTGHMQLQLRPQHLANMLCAFAKLGFTPGSQWMSWFRTALDHSSGGNLQELDHFHIEWAWQELNSQYRLAAGATAGSLFTGDNPVQNPT